MTIGYAELHVRSSIDKVVHLVQVANMQSDQDESAQVRADQLNKLLATAKPDAQSGRLKTEDGRDLAAVLLGQRGGLKGGRARADRLTPEKRKEIAQAAAKARWGSKNND